LRVAWRARRCCPKLTRAPCPRISPTPPSDRLLDDFLITLRRKLPNTSAAGLSTIAQSLPSLSSGVRLNEIVAEAQQRYDAAAAAEAEAATAAAAADAAYYEQQQQQQEPFAAPEAVTA
jgi:hypothetical protein